MAVLEGLSRQIFRGRVQRENAVSVRGSDGLFHYGWLIRKEEDGLLIDFKYGPDRMRIIPFGSVFRLNGEFSVFDDNEEFTIETPLKENDHVEVLLQSRFSEPWKWHPGTLLAADFEKGSFGHVSVSLSADQTFIVPGQQIRMPLNTLEMEHLLINSTDPVDLVVHYPLPLDFRMNHLPKTILAEIFDCSFTDQQTKMRRVCSLWNDIVVATAGSIVNLYGWKYRKPAYWLSLWNPKTRIVVVDAFGSRSDHPSGFFVVRNLASLMKQVIDRSGFSRLVGVGLRGICISEKNSGFFCEKLKSLWDALVLFGSTCRFIKLLHPKFKCYRSSFDELTVSNKWTDASETGDFDRFFTSFSVHFNNDIKDEILEAWIHGQTAANSMRKSSGKAVHVPVRNRRVTVNVKHTGMPLNSLNSRMSFLSNVDTRRTVAVRGDDGLMHYAWVVAKENNGLLVDFRNAKPFAFVPFGDVYYFPSNFTSHMYLSGKLVEVLLRLEPGEPWKWYPAKRIYADTGDILCDFTDGFVEVYVAKDTTVTAIVPLEQLRFPYTAAELEKHLLKNGDGVDADMHHRLDWEMKINDLSLVVLKQVLDCFKTAALFKVRAVSKVWDEIVGTATINTIHLMVSAHRSLTCLNYAWSREITTVIIEDMGSDFSLVCHLLGRYALQNGCVPLKSMVLVGFNDLPVSYTYGTGFDADLSLLKSVCQSLVFRNVQVDLRMSFDNHMSKEHIVNVELLSAQIDLTETDCAAGLCTMIGENVRKSPKSESQLDAIRSYFCQPSRSLECVDHVLQLLDELDNAMYGTSTDRKKQWPGKYLLALQPEKLGGLAVAAVAHAIESFSKQ